MSDESREHFGRSDPLWKALERAATTFSDDPAVPYEMKPEWWNAEEINRLAALHTLGNGKVFETRAETQKTFGGELQEAERFLIVHHPAGGDPIELNTWSRTLVRRLPRKVERIVACLMAWQQARERQLSPSPEKPAGDRTIPSSAQADWSPPCGYVGRKTVCTDKRFQKKGKNPSPTTIDGWVNSAKKQDQLIAIEKDPATGENYYPEAWIMERIATWNPRTSAT